MSATDSACLGTKIDLIAPRFRTIHLAIMDWVKSSGFTVEVYNRNVLRIVGHLKTTIAIIRHTSQDGLQRCYTFFWMKDTMLPRITTLRDYLSCGKRAVLIADHFTRYVCIMCQSHITRECGLRIPFCERCSAYRRNMKTADRAAQSWLIVGAQRYDLCADVVSYIGGFIVRLATHLT